MNFQKKCQQYAEYGLEKGAIVARIGLDYIDEAFVARALDIYDKDTFVDYTNNKSRVRERRNPRMIPYCELIWQHGPKYWTDIKKTKSTYELARIHETNQYTIKHIYRYFGLKNWRVPKNALVLLGYVPDSVKKEVNRLDHHICCRCQRGMEDLPKKRMDYHIIDTNKVASVENVMTLCYYCHNQYIHNFLERQKGVDFTGFDRDSLGKFINYYYNINNGPKKGKYNHYRGN